MFESGLPLVFKLIFWGNFIGSCSSGTVLYDPFSSYIIGIGQPQYLCLETPQSFNLKLIFFFPIFFSSKIFMVSITDSSGALKPFKNFELKKDWKEKN